MILVRVPKIIPKITSNPGFPLNMLNLVPKNGIIMLSFGRRFVPQSGHKIRQVILSFVYKNIAVSTEDKRYGKLKRRMGILYLRRGE